MTMEQREESAFIKYSLAAFMSWIEREFEKRSGKKLTTKTVTGPAALRQMSAQLNRPDREGSDSSTPSKLSYPYLLNAIGDISIDDARNGMNKRAYHKVVLAKDINAGTAIALDVRPVRVGVGVTFNTDNQDDLLAFVAAILMNAPSFSVIFTGDNDFNIGIEIVLDPNVSAPPINYETPGDAYQFNTVVTLRTFIGDIVTLRLIKEMKVSVINQSMREEFFVGPKEVLYSKTTDFVDAILDRR